MCSLRKSCAVRGERVQYQGKLCSMRREREYITRRFTSTLSGEAVKYQDWRASVVLGQGVQCEERVCDTRRRGTVP